MSKPSKGKKQSGDPRKRAQQAAAAAELHKPCMKCGKREASRGGMWCMPCSNAARARGRANRPSPASIRKSVMGVAVDLGVADAEGNLLPEATA